MSNCTCGEADCRFCFARREPPELFDPKAAQIDSVKVVEARLESIAAQKFARAQPYYTMYERRAYERGFAKGIEWLKHRMNGAEGRGHDWTDDPVECARLQGIFETMIKDIKDK